jgi:hypothetical protein
MFDIITYFKNIAQKHYLITHNEQNNPAFFREFDTSSILFENSDFLVKMRKVAKTAMVVQFNEDGGVRGSSIDNKFRYKTGAVFLIKKVKVADYNEIENVRKEMSSIWDDIYTKLQMDIRTGAIPPPFDLDVSIKSVGMIGDSYYGLAIFMNYSEKYCVKFNPNNWLE